MKNIMKIIICISLIHLYVYADSYGRNFDLTLKLARIKKVETVSEKVLVLKKYIERYIIETGSLNVTKEKINEKYNLTSSNWKSYSSDEISFIMEGKKLKFLNIIPTDASDIVKNTFLNTNIFNINLGVVSVDDYSVNLPLSLELMSFLRVLDGIDKNKASISDKTPSSIDKLWYKPTGVSALEIKKYNASSNKWESIGIIGDKEARRSLGVKECLGVFESKSDLDDIVAYDEACANVFEDSILKKYYYVESEKKWITDTQTIQEKTIYSIINDDFNAPIGTVRVAEALYNEYEGEKEFTKIKEGNIELWKSSDNNFIILKDIENRNNSYSKAFNGITNYVKLENGNIEKLYYSEEDGFYHEANGYDDILKRFVSLKHLNKIYDKKNKKMFVKKIKNNEEYFEHKDVKNTTYTLLSIKREKAPTINEDDFIVKYFINLFTLVNDCNNLCYGGKYSQLPKVDNLYSFIYVKGSEKAIKKYADLHSYNSFSKLLASGQEAATFKNEFVKKIEPTIAKYSDKIYLNILKNLYLLDNTSSADEYYELSSIYKTNNNKLIVPDNFSSVKNNRYVFEDYISLLDNTKSSENFIEDNLSTIKMYVDNELFTVIAQHRYLDNTTGLLWERQDSEVYIKEGHRSFISILKGLNITPSSSAILYYSKLSNYESGNPTSMEYYSYYQSFGKKKSIGNEKDMYKAVSVVGTPVEKYYKSKWSYLRQPLLSYDGGDYYLIPMSRFSFSLHRVLGNKNGKPYYFQWGRPNSSYEKTGKFLSVSSSSYNGSKNAVGFYRGASFWNYRNSILPRYFNDVGVCPSGTKVGDAHNYNKYILNEINIRNYRNTDGNMSTNYITKHVAVWSNERKYSTYSDDRRFENGFSYVAYGSYVGAKKVKWNAEGYPVLCLLENINLALN